MSDMTATGCLHEPIGAEVFTESGEFRTDLHPSMTHIEVAIQGAEGGTAADGTRGVKPELDLQHVRADMLHGPVKVEVGKGGRSAPGWPQGADGWVFVAVYDCGCAVGPRDPASAIDEMLRHVAAAAPNELGALVGVGAPAVASGGNFATAGSGSAMDGGAGSATSLTFPPPPAWRP